MKSAAEAGNRFKGRDRRIGSAGEGGTKAMEPTTTNPTQQLGIEHARAGQCTVGALARRLGVTSAEVRLLVDRMEEHGFVERVRDADDRRVVWVRLTPSAPAVVTVTLRAKRALLESFVSETPEEEREGFVRTLARFIPVLARTRDETPAKAAETLYPSCWT
jgi:DNA-binding MarR family transcriptional regulator